MTKPPNFHLNAVLRGLVVDTTDAALAETQNKPSYYAVDHLIDELVALSNVLDDIADHLEQQDQKAVADYTGIEL